MSADDWAETKAVVKQIREDWPVERECRGTTCDREGYHQRAKFHLTVANLLEVLTWFPSTEDPTNMLAAFAVAEAYRETS